MSEVKNIPRLRFPLFHEEWKPNSIGDLAKVIRGASPRPKGDPRFYGGNVPRLMGTDVTRDGKYVTPTTDFLTQAGSKKSRFLPKGTLTMTCSGNVGIPSFLNIDACIHDGFLAFVDRSDKILDDYLFYSLFVLKNKLERGATHGGVFTNLTTDIVRNYTLSIPSLPEQQKISDFLTAVDKRIELLEKKKTLLETYKKGVMKKIFNQEIRFKDDNGNDFPDWEEKRLEDVLNYEQPTKYLVQSTEYSDRYELPVLTAGKSFILGFTNETDGIFKNIPTIIFDDFTTSFHYVDFEFKVKSSAMKMLNTKSKDYDLKFVYEIMKTLKFTMSEHKRYWISEYSQMFISIPVKEEQIKITKFSNQLDNQINLLTNQIDKSKTWKKGLLQKMFV